MRKKVLPLLDKAIKILCEENSPEEYEEAIATLCKAYNILNAKLRR